MKGAIRKSRMTPRKTVEFQFDQLKALVRNILVDNRNFKPGEDRGRTAIPHAFRDGHSDTPREISASRFAAGPLQEMASLILERLDSARELCADMAADAVPEASHLFLLTAPEHDEERLVRAVSVEKAIEFFTSHLRDLEYGGPVRIVAIQLPPEDAVTDGVLDWAPFRRGAVDVVVPDRQMERESDQLSL